MFHIPVPDVLLTQRCQFKCDYCFEKKSNRDIDPEKFEEFMKEACFTGFFPFGGEPLLRIDLLTKILDMSDEYQKKLLTKNLITNGVLIPKYVDILKKYNIHVQISIDGPRHVHNMNRKYPDGRGTFDDVLKGISACIKHKIPWSIHSVCNKETLPYFSESMKFYVRVTKLQGKQTAINSMDKNTIQIIFEEDYTDKDVDILIEEFYKIADWMMNDKSFTQQERYMLLNNFTLRKGAVCGAGTGLKVVDSDFNVYPCHRIATLEGRDEQLLGNIYKPKEFKNYKVYNSYNNLKRVQFLYSAVTNLAGGFNNSWFMWCPATNQETSDSIYYQNAKYNVMFTEIGRAVKDIKRIYKIKDGNPEQRNNCGRH
ncbi:MAG: radical SAM protein [Saprospiraceae bacterium]